MDVTTADIKPYDHMTLGTTTVIQPQHPPARQLENGDTITIETTTPSQPRSSSVVSHTTDIRSDILTPITADMSHRSHQAEITTADMTQKDAPKEIPKPSITAVVFSVIHIKRSTLPASSSKEPLSITKATSPTDSMIPPSDGMVCKTDGKVFKTDVKDNMAPLTDSMSPTTDGMISQIYGRDDRVPPTDSMSPITDRIISQAYGRDDRVPQIDVMASQTDGGKYTRSMSSLHNIAPVTKDINAPLLIIPQLPDNTDNQNKKESNGRSPSTEYHYVDSQHVWVLSTHSSSSFNMTRSEYWRHRWKKKIVCLVLQLKLYTF